MFKRFDKHRKGKLTKDDFATTLKKMVPISNQEMVYVWQIVDKNTNGSIDLKEFEAFLNEGREKKIIVADDDDKEENKVVEEKRKKKKKKKTTTKKDVEPVTESEMTLFHVFVHYAMQGEITRPAVMTICQMMRLLRDAGLLANLKENGGGSSSSSSVKKKMMFGTPTSSSKKRRSNKKIEKKKKKKGIVPHFMTPIQKSVEDDGTTHGESTRKWRRDLNRLDSRHRSRGPKDPWVPSPHGCTPEIKTKNFHASHITMKEDQDSSNNKKKSDDDDDDEEEDGDGILSYAEFDILFNQALRWRDGTRGPRGAYGRKKHEVLSFIDFLWLLQKSADTIFSKDESIDEDENEKVLIEKMSKHRVC